MRTVRYLIEILAFILLSAILLGLVVISIKADSNKVSLVEIKYGELVFHRRNISLNQCQKELDLLRATVNVKAHCLPYRLQAGRDSLSFIGGRYER